MSKPPEDDVCTEPSPVSHLTDLILQQEDPVIEYEDEFGRQRTARRSEVPRHLLPRDPDEEPPEEDIEYVTQSNILSRVLLIAFLSVHS